MVLGMCVGLVAINSFAGLVGALSFETVVLIQILLLATLIVWSGDHV